MHDERKKSLARSHHIHLARVGIPQERRVCIFKTLVKEERGRDLNLRMIFVGFKIQDLKAEFLRVIVIFFLNKFAGSFKFRFRDRHAEIELNDDVIC